MFPSAAELGAAGTSEPTPNTYIQEGRRGSADLSTPVQETPLKAAGARAMPLLCGLHGTAGASSSIPLRGNSAGLLLREDTSGAWRRRSCHCGNN